VTRQFIFPDLFLSLPHECGYLPDRQATSLFVDPGNLTAAQHYTQFLQSGFRRSGRLIYRPHCQSCTECISVRIPVNRFTARRGQKRLLKRNTDLVVLEKSPYFSEEHFDLYKKYQGRRHKDGSMDHDDRNMYEDFLVRSPIDTRFFEFRNQEEKLLAVAVSDFVEDGLSAVYTYFDPDETRRGLGVFAVLWQIQETIRLGLDHLYLGYWIKDCAKMAYKQDYQPLEAWGNGAWEILITK